MQSVHCRQHTVVVQGALAVCAGGRPIRFRVDIRDARGDRSACLAAKQGRADPWAPSSGIESIDAGRVCMGAGMCTSDRVGSHCTGSSVRRALRTCLLNSLCRSYAASDTRWCLWGYCSEPTAANTMPLRDRLYNRSKSYNIILIAWRSSKAQPEPRISIRVVDEASDSGSTEEAAAVSIGREGATNGTDSTESARG